MMISPEAFVEEYKDYSYEQLIAIRNDYFNSILDYESSVKHGDMDTEAGLFEPSPEIMYQMDMDYLIKLLELMQDKYKGDDKIADFGTEEEQIGYIRNILLTKHEYVSERATKKAKALLERLIKNKNAEALLIKGAMYYEGNGFPQDQKKAVSLYKRSAELGNSIAMSNLGYAFFYGNGVAVNYEKAYLYFTMAEQRGEWDAYNMLGDMYRDGIYVTKDEQMAFSLYDRCYREVPHKLNMDAYPACLVRLGECFYKGIGINVNDVIAKNMLEEARYIYQQQIEAGNYYARLCIDRVNKDLEEVYALIKEAECIAAGNILDN